MDIAFRVDASNTIGTGHFMRCLALADAMKPFNINISFICRHLPYYLQKNLAHNGYHFIHLNSHPYNNIPIETKYSHWLGVSQKQDAIDTVQVLSKNTLDWLVIDHYALDYRWESAVQNCTGKILVIDDLADRNHNCDLLLDQNLYLDMRIRYRDKVPTNCKLLLGPQYALLRNEFCQIRKSTRLRSGPIRNILIFFGGTDSNNDTGSALMTLINSVGRHLIVDVVIGKQHPFFKEIQLTCKENRFTCHIQTNKMAELMSKADLAIGAGGISTYERLYLRLPAILKPISLNQIEPLVYMSKIGLFDIFFTQQELNRKLREVFKRNNVSPPDCVEYGCKKIVNHMISGITVLRNTQPLDIRRTFIWLQNTKLRNDFLIRKIPERRMHFDYWRMLIESSEQKSYSIIYSREHVGNCGLKNINHQEKSCEIWIYLANISARGQGVSTSAVSQLISIARNNLASTLIYLHVAKNNKSAIRLYRRTGFEPSKKLLSSRWSDRGPEVLLMEQSL
jgi:UDP-2,4-diacetamido-2,4,6-trideoxy-beta-L-altropyranose hydrolase